MLSCAWGGFSPGAAGSACPALPPTPPPHPPSPVAHLDAGRGAEAAGNSGGPPQAQGSAATHGWCCRAGAVPHSAIPWLIIPSSPLQCISARGRVVQLLSTARSARTPASLQRPPVQVGRKPLPCPVGGAGSGALQHYRVLCSKGSPAAARQGPGTACLTSPPPPAGSDACRRDGLPGKLRERGRVLPFHPALLPVTYISCCQMEGGERSIASLPAPLLLGERFPGGAGRCCQVPALPSPPPPCPALLCFHSPTRILNEGKSLSSPRGKKTSPQPCGSPRIPPVALSRGAEPPPALPKRTPKPKPTLPVLTSWSGGNRRDQPRAGGFCGAGGHSSSPRIEASWHRRAPQCGKGSRARGVLAPRRPWVAEGHVLATSFSGGSTAVMINLHRSVPRSVFLLVSNAGKCSSPARHPHTLPCPRARGKSHPDACNGGRVWGGGVSRGGWCGGN